MGQEESHIVDENTPTVTLTDRSIEAVAKYIKDGGAGRIVVMVSYHWRRQ
jgi:NAD-dependent histone deacetylase SIR2